MTCETPVLTNKDKYNDVRLSPGFCCLLPDACGRQTYQLTASAIVTAQPDAAAPTLIHTTLHRAALHCTLRRGFRASAQA